MTQVDIKFPDGSVRKFEQGTTGLEIAQSISSRLAKEAIAVKVNNTVMDLNTPLPEDTSIEILTFEHPEGRKIFWHSSSHIMAQAVLELFPNAKLAIGPSIEEGWYYDFEVEKPFSPEDLIKIEKKMQEIIAENAPFQREVKSRQEVIKHFQETGAIYKVEILEEIPDEEVTLYHQSRFEDLCRGPHIPRTGMIKAFKLIATSGAYWRGDEKRTMLQRIYGVSYPKKSLLDDYLHRLEEAKKRDHRVLGKQLELFTISESVGAGLILWLPRGARVRNEIENFWREEHLKFGYDLVYSPHIANRKLWEQSGHTDFYSDDMFGPIEVENNLYQLKPMNCPFHIVMYKSRLWSYRDLPLRWAELGTVYRYERAGVLHGLMRVRGFTQDDAHHFVVQEKMEDELVWILEFCLHILKSFGFTNYEIYLSTMPEKAIGAENNWRRAEDGLRHALEKIGLEYNIDEGGGAFYGPKIDIKIKDALGRSWQCSTIQFDFSLPERFDLYYIDSHGQQKRPFMIHRALLGSIERFFGVLIEHYSGNFPLWLAPVQVKVLPVTDNFIEYGKEIVDKLKENKIRTVLDDRSEKIGAKIRNAEIFKIPYMLVIGAREVESKTVSIRKHSHGDLGTKKLDEVISLLQKEIRLKGLNEN
ncbi:MAG: threonine--tRNA ligase [FCB group bacterium]|nr:threonine--tRNA ligase [FCB group bacterium]